ncbi:MAG: NAD-dependent epimerase/dehydratase family protein [Myxococcales bacterium]|nr:NAD-dependent epimerase/dehydratase family protein [Myxococcales bacterium]
MRALVTGGHGFLGAELVRQLREAGHEATPASRQSGVDILDRAALTEAMVGHDVVFHVAAKAGVWGPAAEFEAINVTGTENVLAAARATGVGRLVYTSSPSVVFDGGDHLDAGNDLPYPTRWLADYPRTKALAEQLILTANTNALHTVALRPHLIYGPGDPHLLPRLVARARSGRLRIVGKGDNRVSLTYVKNAAAAHLQAAIALAAPGCPAAGRAFFVNDAVPVVLWDWLGQMFAGVGIASVHARVPAGLAYAFGGAAEWVWRTFALGGEPPMTRFVALQLATSHTYSLRPAQVAFGYAPPVAGDVALAETLVWLKAEATA